MNSLTLHILDHRLTARTGHHFDFCHLLATGLVRRHHSVAVYGHLHARPDVAEAFHRIPVPFSGLFSRFDLPRPDGPPVRELETLAQGIAAELDALPPADLLLFPTLFPEMLLAWSFMNSPVPLLGIVHLPPDYLHPYGSLACSLAAERARRRGLSAILGVVDPVLEPPLRACCGDLPVENWPVPIGGTPRPAPAPYLRTIGFFGHQREERGKSLLPPLVHRLLSLGFHVVYHDTLARFEKLAPHPRLRLLPFVDDLAAEMSACDLAVCLMDRSRYAQRLSGIACQALALGLPLILPADTLCASRFHPLGSSVLYTHSDVDPILHAIIDLSATYPARAAAALRAAAHWNLHHGLAPFLDRISSLAFPFPPPAPMLGSSS